MASYFDELVERVKTLTGLDTRESFKVADTIMEAHDEQPPSSAEIVDTAAALGFDVERKHGKDDAPVNEAPIPEITVNPVEVLAEVYKVCPRVLTTEFPVIGRVPRESVFYDEAIQEALAQLPEELRILVADVDLYNGAITVTLYDAMNDLDRKIGPINLERYESAEAIHNAIVTLIGRLPVVLAADFN